MEFGLRGKFTHTIASLNILIVRVFETNLGNENKQIQKKSSDLAGLIQQESWR